MNLIIVLLPGGVADNREAINDYPGYHCLFSSLSARLISKISSFVHNRTIFFKAAKSDA
jgi:hypothetical protein